MQHTALVEMLAVNLNGRDVKLKIKNDGALNILLLPSLTNSALFKPKNKTIFSKTVPENEATIEYISKEKLIKELASFLN